MGVFQQFACVGYPGFSLATLLVLFAIGACSPVTRVHVPASPSVGAGCLHPSVITLAPSSEFLSAGDIDRLLAGERVEVPNQFEHCGGHYVGGVGYVLVNASPREIFDSLNQVANLAQVIRGTRSMTVTSIEVDGVHILMEQGNSLVSAKYTTIFRATLGSDVEEDWEVRFWLDDKQPHAIDDVWGIIHARRFDDTRTLVMAGTALNLGPGLIRMLFEDRVQGSILRMPRYVREVVEGERMVP